ncbi:micronuclear linker histone polyprotein-like [Littorina saxatilis]|uniref:Uncharacterized protein n=1 Tax=Littorina saxatilis TaxID=31220 RepID=A0AAN9APL5_9CAEN
MSHATISPFLLQLFEVESRVVDKLLTQTKDGRPLQKPSWLGPREHLPSASSSSTTTRTTHSVENSSGSSTEILDPMNQLFKISGKNTHVNSSVLSLSSLSSSDSDFDGSTPFLTKESFSVQDPVSSAIDNLHSAVLLRAERPKLVKPRWIPTQVLQNQSSPPTPLLPEAEVCGVSTHKASNIALRSEVQRKEEDTNTSAVSVPSANRYNLRKSHSATSLGIKTRRRKHRKSTNSVSESEQQDSIDEAATPARRRKHRKSTNSVSESEQLDSIDEAATPASSSSVKSGSDFLKEVLIGRSSLRKRPHENDGKKEDKVSTSSPKDRDERSSTGATSKRQRLSQNGVQTEVKDATTRQRGTESRKGKRLQSKKRKHSTADFDARLIMRRRKRRVVHRTTNMMCVSCKHGILSTQCQVCVSATTVNTNSPTGPKKTALKTAPNALKIKNRSNLGMKKASVTNKSGRQVTSVVTQNSSTRTVKKNVQALCTSTQSQKCSLIQQQKNVNAQKLLKKAHKQQASKKKQSQKAVSDAGRKKLIPKQSAEKRPRKQQSKTKLGPRNNVEDSIIQRHKQLSSESPTLNDEQRFSSAKDMFSQLCQLEERSKEYDMSALEAMMPLTQPAGETVFRKPAALFPWSSNSSHVGGIWKSIFSKR